MTPKDRETLREQLIKHEDVRLKLYRDSLGIETIGVGRNLRDVGITFAEAMTLLDHDIDTAIAGLTTAWPWSARLDPVRYRVMVDLCFNLGLTRLKGFTQTLAAIERGDYATASEAMLESLWARQVGKRAETLATMMRTGTIPEGTLVA